MLDDRITEALTFDDVLLVPQRSDVLPSEVDISTRLTRSITLRTPIISAARRRRWTRSSARSRG